MKMLQHILPHATKDQQDQLKDWAHTAMTMAWYLKETSEKAAEQAIFSTCLRKIEMLEKEAGEAWQQDVRRAHFARKAKAWRMIKTRMEDVIARNHDTAITAARMACVDSEQE